MTVAIGIARYVWRAGRAVWAEGVDAFYHGNVRRPYPLVLCETCGLPACGVSFEMIDTTLPEDEFVNKLPGRPHHFCQDHELTYAHA